MQLERSTENHQCCVNNSILASENGDRPRDALVNINVGCYGFSKQNFQQWIDYTVSENLHSGSVGLCFEGWRHVVKGTLIEYIYTNSISQLLFIMFS